MTVSVLSRENNGVASDELLAIVRDALNDEDVRPVADRVTVQSAKIVDYKITASLYLYPGPESEPVLSAAKQSYRRISPRSTASGVTSVNRPSMRRSTSRACSVSSWPRRWLTSFSMTRRRHGAASTASP